MSVASPVVMDSPRENIAMLVEKSDFIKAFMGLRDYHSSGNSNSNNTDLTGHAFTNYIYGDDTSPIMNNAYNQFFDELFPSRSDLTITATTSGNVEFMALELYDYNNAKMHIKTTTPNSQLESMGSPIRGKLSRNGSTAKYTIGCNLLGDVSSSLNLCVWNKSGSDIDVLMNYSGMYNDSRSDTIEYNSNGLEYYDCHEPLTVLKKDGEVITIGF